MNHNYKSIMKASLLLPLAGCGGEPQEVDSRPNIVLIMADDLGYSDITCYNGFRAQTPVLDQMAKDGVILSDYHSNGAVSSPTRAALMTGKYQQRTGVTGVISAANHREVGLALEEVTIADRLSELGYNTGIFGKWHLGYPAEFNPTKQGFDEFQGFVAGNIDYHAHIDEAGYFDWWRGEELDRDAKGYITDLITDGSIDFIKRNDPQKTGEPFFLYIPYPAPHYPYQSVDCEPVREEGNPKYIRKVNKEDSPRLYQEIIEHTDRSIGTILATLKELGLEENTMVIFCSDNGPNGSGNTGGFRGRKGSVYEGGHRVPCIIKYPAAITKHRLVTTAVMGMDFFPTFVEMAGGDPSQDKIDGVSILSHLTTGERLAPRDLFWEHNDRVAVRDERGWKLVVTPQKSGEPKYEIFNMMRDPGEEDDHASVEGDRIEFLLEKIKAWREDVYSDTPSMI